MMASHWKRICGVWLLIFGLFQHIQGDITTDSFRDKELLRAIWIPTVENSMWPSSPDTSSKEKREELLSILDTASLAKISSIFFQVRSHGDAIYRSNIEPWSEHLTGQQGRAPADNWDPLVFLITEAQKRNIVVHAWVNLFRAGMVPSREGLAKNHACKTISRHCYRHGDYLWMDPGSHQVRGYTMEVIKDIVTRYNISGIHVDDFYYPPNVEGRDFPDDLTYRSYAKGGGRLSKNRWRHHTIKHFLSRLIKTIKAMKSNIKFSLDTLGLYRETGDMSLEEEKSYYGYYTTPDSYNWPNAVIGDFLTPRLHWELEDIAEEEGVNSTPVLLDWRVLEDPLFRRLFVGNEKYKVLNREWEVFTLCGRKDCKNHRHHRVNRRRSKRAENESEDETETQEDLRRKVKFEVFLPMAGKAEPVISDGSEGFDEVVITTKPDIVGRTSANSTYNITWYNIRAKKAQKTVRIVFLRLHPYMCRLR